MGLLDKIMFWRTDDDCDQPAPIAPVEGYEVNGCFTGVPVNDAGALAADDVSTAALADAGDLAADDVSTTGEREA